AKSAAAPGSCWCNANTRPLDTNFNWARRLAQGGEPFLEGEYLMATKNILTKDSTMATDDETIEITRIPMMLPGQALHSLRDAGFDFAAALGEPIDNSIEAKANHIHVRLDEDKVKGKNRVVRVVIADDGTGMDEHTLTAYERGVVRISA